MRLSAAGSRTLDGHARPSRPGAAPQPATNREYRAQSEASATVHRFNQRVSSLQANANKIRINASKR
jgi:hypothetical protein